MKFLDQVKIYIKAGNGGDGSPSFRREKYVEFGGPDGGDGGRGGSIILKSEENLNTLIDYRYQQHHKAQRGENGSGQNRTGKSGDDLVLKVPLGTQVFEEDNKTLLFDFNKKGEEYIAANGGKGGWEILDLKVLQTELQENLRKELWEKSLQFGYNLKQ